MLKRYDKPPSQHRHVRLVREASPLIDRPPTDSTVYEGDASKLLERMPEGFFQSCVTSPPYWGLRDYGITGQIGAEEDPEEYIARLVEVFAGVFRVLRDDGTLWLNIGDSYTSGNRGYRATDKKNPVRQMSYRPKTPNGLKEKELVGVPWRLAFALQKIGWYLRSDIIWEKPNCMPESVKDRPTRSHEYFFLFAKSPRYYYNGDLIREANGRNRRTVWSIPTEPFNGAHFATFPPRLIEPCILAATRQNDWVLDPFLGSGTVAMICAQQSRKYVGIELNPEYIRIALKRIASSQRSLFAFDDYAAR